MLKRLYNKTFKNATTVAEPTETGTTTFHSLLVSLSCSDILNSLLLVLRFFQ